MPMLIGPPGGGVSVNGIEFKCGPHGDLVIPAGNPDVVKLLTETHGFRHATPEDQERMREVDRQPPQRQRPIPEPVVKAQEQPAPAEDRPPAAATIDPETADRPEMFAWVKERGIEVARNITTDKLRDVIKDVIAQGAAAAPAAEA